MHLRVKVSPGARADLIAGWQGDVLRLRVRAAPERGKANAGVCRLIARTLGVSPGDVSVLHGHASREKLLSIQGLDEASVLARLNFAPNPPENG